MWLKGVIIFANFCLICTSAAFKKPGRIELAECNLSQDLVEEIASYEGTVQRIADCFVNGPCKGSTYQHLANFIDTFSNRLSGTKNLENAIDYMLQKSKNIGMENVHGEEVNVPHWERGNESAFMIEPRLQKLEMLAFGGSVGTPPEGITAEVLVVDSFEELDANADHVAGKIVVFNQEYVSYGGSAEYRQFGVVRTAKLGGVATLLRAVTPFAMNHPHTGFQSYDEATKKIPSVCITPEDAHMLRRMQDRGLRITIRLTMDAKTMPEDAISRNGIAEIRGTEMPEKVVVVSGHIDSWDVGRGAMDDGAGFMMSWNALAVLKRLELRPRRTMRVIMWTGEEQGLRGAFRYFEDHESELDTFNVMMESDFGTFAPIGLNFGGVDEAACIMEEIMKHFNFLNATTLYRTDDVSSDITLWQQRGVPAVSLYNHNEKYFWFHHSAADTMDVEDEDILDTNTILWTSAAYILADLSVDIPNNITL